MLRKLIAVTAWVFVGAMVVNTAIALYYGWPAEFDAPGRPETSWTDFILHGTRISPPVHALVVLAVAGWFTLHQGWRGIAGTAVLAAFSMLVTIAAAGEPAGLPPNEIPHAVWFILGSIGRFAPILLIGMGLIELSRRALLAKRQRLGGVTSN
jgi:hypothetical protein